MAPPYRLIVSQVAREQFRALGRSSVYTGRGDEISRAMRQVGQLLTHSPRAVGDPLYLLRAAKLQVRSLTHASLYLEYGVHESEPLVIIRFVASFRGKVE